MGQGAGWACANGKAITRKTWTGEIPSHKAMVALAAEGELDYWMDVYSMLSGATHSQPLLMTLSLGDEPETHLDRALMVLDIGISFYTDALRQLAEFMGWRDMTSTSGSLRYTWQSSTYVPLTTFRFPSSK